MSDKSSPVFYNHFQSKEGLNKINDLNARHKQPNRLANETSNEASGTPVLLLMTFRASLDAFQIFKEKTIEFTEKLLYNEIAYYH